MTDIKQNADRLLSEAYGKYQLEITKYCSIRIKENRSALEDCVQETFLVYYNKLLEGEEILNPHAFLYKTASVLCRGSDTEFLRRAKKTVDIETMEDVAATEVDEKASSLDYDKLKKLLIKELSESEQAIYILKYEQRKSLKEIGEILGIPPNAVANRTSRLRTKIKNLVGPTIEKYTEGGVTL